TPRYATRCWRAAMRSKATVPDPIRRSCARRNKLRSIRPERLFRPCAGGGVIMFVTFEDRSHAMIVKQIWTGNSYRNFNYLIACAETGEALAVDPLDHEKCLRAAKEAGWKITQILNTHEHRDHTGGNTPMVQKTGAKIIAHKNAKDKIADISRGLSAGDVV